MTDALMQHTATHCNTLQHLQHTATRCRWHRYVWGKRRNDALEHAATHCNTLQHTATHCIIWQMASLFVGPEKTDDSMQITFAVKEKSNVVLNMMNLVFVVNL